MENGVDALKIAFGMIIFVLAISITISSFTSTIEAMNKIWEVRQSEESYVTDADGNYLNYVNFNGGTRIVSAETIVPNMYRAYKENFAIYFYTDTAAGAYELYETTNADGTPKSVNYIDLIQESFSDENAAITHLNSLLEGGLYNTLKGNTFTEYLGEYYLEDVNGETNTPETNKNKKRVIAYVLN